MFLNSIPEAIEKWILHETPLFSSEKYWTPLPQLEISWLANLASYPANKLSGPTKELLAKKEAFKKSEFFKVSVAYDTDGKGSRYLRQFEAAANCNRCLNGLYYMKQLPATDENSAEQNAVDKQLNMKINDRLVLYWSRKTVKADSPLSWKQKEDQPILQLYSHSAQISTDD